jgi:hypothetical protein
MKSTYGVCSAKHGKAHCNCSQHVGLMLDFFSISDQHYVARHYSGAIKL